MNWLLSVCKRYIFCWNFKVVFCFEIFRSPNKIVTILLEFHFVGSKTNQNKIVVCDHRPYGVGEQWGFLISSVQSLGICPTLEGGNFYGQSPAKSPALILVGKCEITAAGLDMESKAPHCHGTAGTILSSKHGTYKLRCVPAISGPGLTRTGA